MLKFSCTSQLAKSKSSDVLLLPFWEEAKGAKRAGEPLKGPKPAAIALGDFKAKNGELSLIYESQATHPRILLLGLGSESAVSADSLRQAYAQAAKECQKRKWASLSVEVPLLGSLVNLTAEELLKAACEGILMGHYHWPKKEDKSGFRHIEWVGVLPAHLALFEKTELIMSGVFTARDLINQCAHATTPEFLACFAKGLAKEIKGSLKATVLDLEDIKKEKMGLLLAVSQGAAVEPRFITLSYQGHKKAHEHTVLIGKGITYDTGGLNLKPTGHMETMKSDMSGAAAVLATVATAALLKLPVNVTAVVPAAENAIGPNSFKPGDVFCARNGTRVEIGNTDAEGRLILADAISYAIDHLKPTRIIDLATLTGSIVIALGDEIAGLFCNDEQLACKLLQASKKVGEPLWQMPLYAGYKEKLKSSVADLCNVGGRSGGAVLAALFLQHFLPEKKNLPWAHIDLAGPAFLDKAAREWPKHGVGFGVRLLLEFLESEKK